MIGGRRGSHRSARAARPSLRRRLSGTAQAPTVTSATRSAGRPGARRRSPRRGHRVRAWLNVFGWTALVLASLLLVTWRQTRGLELERGLREMEGDRAMAEADAVELVRRVEELRSRARIVRVARERLGMQLPDDDDIVFLPSPASSVVVEGVR